MSNSSTRRSFIKGAGVALGMMGLPASAVELLEACSGGASGGGAASPVRGGHIVNGIAQDATILVPNFTADAQSQGIGGQMFEPLVAGYPDNTYVPMLAESLPTISADQTTFTVKLRKNVKWTDGTPFTADDVLFTYRVMYDHTYDKVNSPFRTAWIQNIKSVTSDDPSTVVLQTKGVYASYHDFFGLAILPRHVLGDLAPADLNTTPFRQAPNVTTGPFRFGRWDKGQQVVLERNPAYDRAPVYLDSYVYRVFASATAIANGLETGEVDAGGLDLTEVDHARQSSAIDIVSLPSRSFNFIGFQLDPAKPASKFFSDVRVRQALAHAIDRKRLVKAVLFGYGDVTDSVVPPALWAYNAGVTPKYDLDLQKAQQLLDAAGWTRGPSGTRQKDGAPFQFELMYAVGSPTIDSIAQAVQQMWKQVGVVANLKTVNQVQLVTTLSSNRDFDAVTSNLSFSDPSGPFGLVFSSAAMNPGGFNFMHYRNPDIDTGLKEATGTLDQKKAKPVYDRLQRLVAADLPVIATVSPRNLFAVNKRVKNFARHQTLISTSAWVTDRK